MNYKPLVLSILFLGAVWGVYFWHFHGGFSVSQGDWGTFGDFTGGVVNPLLNFITIYILITQFKTVKSDLDKQRFDESVKAFESSFFTFTTIALGEYKSFETTVNGVTSRGAEAVSAIDDYYEGCCKVGADVSLKFNELDELSHQAIYTLVSSFSVVFKLIEEVCPAEARQKYINLFSMLLPNGVIYILCMSESATKWGLLKYPRDLGYFKKESVAKVLNHYNKLAGK